MVSCWLLDKGAMLWTLQNKGFSRLSLSAYERDKCADFTEDRKVEYSPATSQ